MHREFISVLESYKSQFFYTSWFCVCPWNQHVFLCFLSFHFEVQKAVVNSALFCLFFTYLTEKKETGDAAVALYQENL